MTLLYSALLEWTRGKRAAVTFPRQALLQLPQCCRSWPASLVMSASGHRVQQVGIPHRGGVYNRPLFSVAYKHDNFGSRVAYSSCVVQDAEGDLDDTTE